ncbi:Uncharacterised protein [uncultured archaeon]|nr:Uncharacterised protein [uncultured archaeon]
MVSHLFGHDNYRNGIALGLQSQMRTFTNSCVENSLEQAKIAVFTHGYAHNTGPFNVQTYGDVLDSYTIEQLRRDGSLGE